MYTAENIQELGTETLWITHAPETINEIKAMQNALSWNTFTQSENPRFDVMIVLIVSYRVASN
jgi:transposase